MHASNFLAIFNAIFDLLGYSNAKISAISSLQFLHEETRTNDDFL